ncbi:MAG: U32 family peptidase [Flavobacteriales bacterium]|nr:U32 family peptidase [Flavobacteriales bacterium]MCB9449252.1 U32 family peptidase [Flavobacteriales bacterium]
MAPAGSFESLAAALKGGANSIYFGVEQLNMRTHSSANFTLEDLKEVAQRCKASNAKAYLALNTIIYDHDIPFMKKVVEAAKEAGISAVIASDLAVMQHAKEVGLTVHISTQANVTNVESVRFFSQWADVVVLARELTLQQQASIVREIERKDIKGPGGSLVRTEVFVHGALCMAVSGKCYLSLHTHNASANRGACFQNCRKSYIVTDADDGFEFQMENENIMSAKDLCTVDILDQVIDTGVSVLKIEGRGRSADYVYTATRCYREAADAVLDNTYTPEKVEGWMKDLETVFNRGFWEGYYLGRKLGEWAKDPGSKATEKKVYIGKGRKFFKQAGAAEFLAESQQLSVGDRILVTGPTTGVVYDEVRELRVDEKQVQTVRKGDVFSMPMNESIRASDKLYKLVSTVDQGHPLPA